MAVGELIAAHLALIEEEALSMMREGSLIEIVVGVTLLYCRCAKILTISDIEILRSNCNKETITQWQTARNRARPMKQSTSLVQDGNTKESFQIFIRVSRAAHRNLETHESSRKFDICGYLR